MPISMWCDGTTAGYALPEEGNLVADEEQELHRHIVVVAYRALLRLMVREGFRIEYARGFGYYPLPPLLARPVARLDPWHAHHIVAKGRKPTVRVPGPECQPGVAAVRDSTV